MIDIDSSSLRVYINRCTVVEYIPRSCMVVLGVVEDTYSPRYLADRIGYNMRNMVRRYGGKVRGGR